MGWKTQAARWLGRAAVRAVPVGQAGDGLALQRGSPHDKPWAEWYQEFEDAHEAWRKHPLARRLVGLTTAYAVGPGITLHSDDPVLARFLQTFWTQNRLALRLEEWSDELARSGELFLVLFTDPLTGYTSVRAVAACQIEEIDFDPEDYECERRYRQRRGPGEADLWWVGLGHAEASQPATPLMLHYAANRPVGAVRGESDLAPILPWLRRYSRWLEDRVRLNAAMRAFLWIVHAPGRLRGTLEERYRTPPDAGSVIIAEQGAEEWQAVTPNLHAADAEKDGRALRWMIAAGGPGTGLLDLGEGEDANLATGQAMAELRRRFLRRRQAYLAWMLADLALHAYARWAAVTGYRGRAMTHADVTVITPDISPDDNQELATAAERLASSLQTLAGLVGDSPAYRRMALRLFAKFVGEPLSAQEFETILQEGMDHGRRADMGPHGLRDTQGQRGHDARWDQRPAADPGLNGSGRTVERGAAAHVAPAAGRGDAHIAGVSGSGLPDGAEHQPCALSA